MLQQNTVLFTGGSGLLGGEFKKALPGVHYPSSREFNVREYDRMEEYVKDKDLTMIVHAAAFTSPPKVDRDPLAALSTNIIGTANVVKLCLSRGLRLIYISTDYVFRGDRGNYRESDPVLPVNRYAWSKLGGECAALMYDRSLIIRTTFGPNVFPYEKAFVDQWTSRESVAEIAARIIPLLEKEVNGIVHIGGKRKTVFQYAKSLDPAREIKPLSIKEVNFKVPIDTSLNCEKYEHIMTGKPFSEEET